MMTWDQTVSDIRFTITGIGSLVAALIMYLLNGTLSRWIPELNIPQMEINDGLALLLAIIGGSFTLMKLFNEILKFISQISDMREERRLKKKLKERLKNKKKK